MKISKTSEGQKAYAKAWRARNQGRVKYLQKQWKERNPDSNKKYRPNKRDSVLTVVYVVLAGIFVKIGIAENIKLRMAVIATHCPLPVKVIFCSAAMPRPDARDLEKRCHTKFIGHHVRGEWFEVKPEVVTEFLEKATHRNELISGPVQLRLVS